VLYRTIAAHLPTFLARTGGADGTGGWPTFVRVQLQTIQQNAAAEGRRDSEKLTPPDAAASITPASCNAC
jgi:hypothetical protein